MTQATSQEEWYHWTATTLSPSLQCGSVPSCWNIVQLWMFMWIGSFSLRISRYTFPLIVVPLGIIQIPARPLAAMAPQIIIGGHCFTFGRTYFGSYLVREGLQTNWAFEENCFFVVSSENITFDQSSFVQFLYFSQNVIRSLTFFGENRVFLTF